jgi:hypothetical protein
MFNLCTLILIAMLFIVIGCDKNNSGIPTQSDGKNTQKLSSEQETEIQQLLPEIASINSLTGKPLV